jgi:predicted Zn finger-like uncharacterized protein
MFTQCPRCKKIFIVSTKDLRSDRALLDCPDCNSKFDALELLSDKRPNVKSGRYESLESGDMDKDPIPPVASLLQEMLEEQGKKPHFVANKPKPILNDATNTHSTDRKAPAFEAIPYFERRADTLHRQKKQAPSFFSTTLWGYALLAVLLLLGIQVYYFEHVQLAQNKTVRPALEKVCRLLNCKLPPYRNLNELAILHGSFKPISENNYQLEVVLTNKSTFPQSFPAIKLGLLKFNGEIISSRTFYPEEYLSDKSGKAVIPGNEMVEISLEIVPPKAKIGGYTIDLL